MGRGKSRLPFTKGRKVTIRIEFATDLVDNVPLKRKLVEEQELSGTKVYDGISILVVEKQLY